MDRWDWPTVAAELRALAPSLVLVEFGTNEGYASLARLEPYAEDYERRLKALKAALPNASIVAIGAPDVSDLPEYCSPRSEKAAQPCRELDAEETAHYDGLLRAKDERLCRWHTPAHIAYVRSLQRDISARLGILFWDWSSVQGGQCGASRWAEQGLAHKDRVHLRQEGARISAERLLEVLLRGQDGN
jgi:lysophospholipase L1-like esterase